MRVFPNTSPFGMPRATKEHAEESGVARTVPARVLERRVSDAGLSTANSGDVTTCPVIDRYRHAVEVESVFTQGGLITKHPAEPSVRIEVIPASPEHEGGPG
jgi:hypothetical protein